MSLWRFHLGPRAFSAQAKIVMSGSRKCLLGQRFYYQELAISVQEEFSQATAAGHGLLVEPNDFAVRFGAIWGFLWLRAMPRRQLKSWFQQN